MSGLSDSFQRPINYLRLSVTDRCNLRCRYCMPPQGIPLLPRGELLSYEEMALVVRAAAGLGISKVRLTGGEPLVRADLASLVAILAQTPGIDDLSLTTNGTLLDRHALALKEAGLRRVNVSLDSLRRDRFEQITRGGRLEEVLRGIDAALGAGLSPVKINMVVMGGINDDEVADFARLSLEGWHIRFIELMPFAEGQFVSTSEVRRRVEALGSLESSFPSAGGGPARYFRLPGAKGTIGFISPVSQHFCIGCNRLRLTAQGQLRPCLLEEGAVDLKGPLRAGASLETLQHLLQEATQAKPLRHRLGRLGDLAQGAPLQGAFMAWMGG